MRRRGFVAAGALALTWPTWLARAFAQTVDAEETSMLDEVRARAIAAGRPVLVLVVPADRAESWRRGSAWGELLNHGPDAVMAELALAEVVCVHAATVRASPGEPLAMVIEIDGTVTELDAELPRDPEPDSRDESLTFEELEAIRERQIDARILALGVLVHRGLAADTSMIARRATEARVAHARALGSAARALAGSAPTTLASSTPAEIYAARTRADILEAARLESLLAAQAIADLRSACVPGSRWAIATGCGIEVEGADESTRGMMLCGMGHVPERSRRFLDWLVAP